MQPDAVALGGRIIAVESQLELDVLGLGAHARPDRRTLDRSDPGRRWLRFRSRHGRHRHFPSAVGRARIGHALDRRKPFTRHGNLGCSMLDDPAELFDSLVAPVEVAQRRPEGESELEIVRGHPERFTVLRDGRGVIASAQGRVSLLAGRRLENRGRLRRRPREFCTRSSASLLYRSLALPEMSPSRFVDPSLCSSLTMVAPYTACPPPPRYRRPTLLPVAMMGPFQRKLPLMSALPFSMIRMPVPLLFPAMSSEVYTVLRSGKVPLM